MSGASGQAGGTGRERRTLAERLLREMRRHRIVRYFVAAGVGASVDVVVFALLIYAAGLHYLWAGLGSFLFSTIANYVVSVRIVFSSGSRFPKPLEILLVYGVSTIGLAWHQLILFLCVDRLGIHVMISKVLAIGLVFFWNYFVRRNFVFAPRRN